MPCPRAGAKAACSHAYARVGGAARLRVSWIRSEQDALCHALRGDLRCALIDLYTYRPPPTFLCGNKRGPGSAEGVQNNAFRVCGEKLSNEPYGFF